MVISITKDTDTEALEMQVRLGIVCFDSRVTDHLLLLSVGRR